jgi:predicted branched-subunit amino acid permease
MTQPVFRDGVRDGLPFGLVSLVMGVAFGVVATVVGFPPAATLTFSALVYSAAAQLSVLEIIAGGGGIGAAVGATALVTSRMLPMGLALGPSLRGSRFRRAVEGQALIDPAWVMAARPDGRFNRTYLFGHSGVQWLAWLAGTGAGVAGLEVDVQAWGMDALFPAFFLTLVAAETRNRTRLLVAVSAAVLAALLVPFTPAGAPVVLASAVALIGLRRPRETS